ncbi:GNAT family N-acetyltransferase [Streptomyces tsukubensis]|uniref:GNAT family N-acetyltransferase n=1 Tax=Streptomyces tsukubensis TaxID=83656 RepID=A0A1V4AEE3_9ACTN|nr:GNAT family N-acetyltransferase [Streptomyces tsukubensis]OON82345.1 GNAT family N-acetyltransferase [Streptomyces tsukubensis]QFR92841.1 GNAT family N-acetyltransferase [Streptomyces tsukubensis]
MTLTIRDLDPDSPEDVAGTVDVLRAAIPFMVTTAEVISWSLRNAAPAQRYRLLTAVEDGRVIGRAQTGLSHDSPKPGAAFCNVYVHPDHRGRGAGSLLVRAAEDHLREVGGTSVYSWVLDEPAYRSFAGRAGYRPLRSAHFLRLDLTAGLPPLTEPPSGVELRTAADFAADPRAVFALDAEVSADEPSDVGAELDDYEDWLEHIWGHPLLDREVTTIAVAGGRPVAFSAAYTDGVSQYSSAMTGTARDHRGRGLAKLVKNTALHRAREAGLTEAFTGNDAENGPMLAINKWFGYEVAATEVHHLRELG